MINLNSISVVALSLMLGASVNPKTTAVKEIASVQSVNAGGQVIDDFTQPIYSWWTKSDDMFKLEVEEEKLKVTVKSAGNPAGDKYDCYGRQFDAMDLTKNSVIKMKVKADKAGKIRVDLKDSEGNVANAKPMVKQLNGTDWQELYFDFTGKWDQTYPQAAKVDAVEIVELLIFVNPGGPEFKGTIWMDDIVAIPQSEMPQK